MGKRLYVEPIDVGEIMVRATISPLLDVVRRRSSVGRTEWDARRLDVVISHLMKARDLPIPPLPPLLLSHSART
jgi:hypothetical protein